MEEIYSLIQRRNSQETLPFITLCSEIAYLRNLSITLQFRCESLEHQFYEQKQLLVDQTQSIQANDSANNKSKDGVSKSESRLREKISKLQADLNEKIQKEVKSSGEAVEAVQELSFIKEKMRADESKISNLQIDLDRLNEIINHLTTELEESKSRTRLAENQFDGLKQAIRSLQDENEEITKLNSRLLEETMSEKEKYMEQFNHMNENVEKLQKEVSMLRSLTKMNMSWFSFPREQKSINVPSDDKASICDDVESSGRQWGTVGAVLPSEPQFRIQAHKDNLTCVRYDGTNKNLVATSSTDGTVRVWDTSNGQMQANFSGGGSHPMLGVDISGGIVCGCGSDKTCRVWKYDTKRMIHQLAGHSQKITCVRLFPGEKSIMTASSDRSIRIWDISRHIYHQTVTFRHSSTTNCSDVSGEAHPVATGHLDGGIRLWDIRTGDRVLDISNLHDGGVTSVQYNPNNYHEFLTNGRDSSLKIIDARMNSTICTFQDPEFRTLTYYASSSYSPDGRYVAACGGENGNVFVWSVTTGQLERKLSAHQCEALGLAWGRGGTNGQQVATIDKFGFLILWA